MPVLKQIFSDKMVTPVPVMLSFEVENSVSSFCLFEVDKKETLSDLVRKFGPDDLAVMEEISNIQDGGIVINDPEGDEPAQKIQNMCY